MAAAMNEETALLVDTAKRFADDSGLCAEENSSWGTIAELGWPLVSVAEQQGGMGLGLSGATVLHQALGACLNSAPYLPQMLAISALSELNTSGKRLEELMSATRRATTHLAAAEIEVTGNGKELIVSGVAQAVPSADQCDCILIIAGEQGGPEQPLVALVDAKQKGIEISPSPVWDQSRRLFEVSFANVNFAPDQVLASGDDAAQLGQRLSAVRDLALAADCLGGAAALLQLTVEHMQTRTQFGRPIGMFQALKHRCANLQAMLSAAEAVLFDSVAKFDARDVNPETSAQKQRGIDISVRSATQLAKQTYSSVAEEALQLHGGIGMTEEHYCHLFLKRAMLNEHLGTPADADYSALAAHYLD